MEAVVQYIHWYKDLHNGPVFVSCDTKEDAQARAKLHPIRARFDQYEHLIVNAKHNRFWSRTPTAYAKGQKMHVEIGDVVRELATNRVGMVLNIHHGTVTALYLDKFIVMFATGEKHLEFVREKERANYTPVQQEVLEQLRANPCCDVHRLLIKEEKEEEKKLQNGALVRVQLEGKVLEGTVLWQTREQVHVLDNSNVLHQVPQSLSLEVYGTYCKPNANMVAQQRGERVALKIGDSVRILATQQTGKVKYVYNNGWMIVELNDGFCRARYGFKYVEKIN